MRNFEVTVYLKDGRIVDISALSADEAIARLRSLGITLDDIDHTLHRLPKEASHAVRRDLDA